jgi:DNA-binding NarL/FixJ family response regulator
MTGFSTNEFERKPVVHEGAAQRLREIHSEREAARRAEATSILALIAQGYENSEIAAELRRSRAPRSERRRMTMRLVRRRVAELLEETGARNRTQLAVWHVLGKLQ